MNISSDSINEYENVEKIPDLGIAQLKFTLSLPENKDDNELKKELLEIIQKYFMAPWYEIVCSDLHWKLNQTLLTQMKTKNEEDLKILNEAITDSKESLNDADVRVAYLKKAEYLSRIGDKTRSLAALEQAYEKTIPTSHRIDLLFQCIRVGFFFMDHILIAKYLERAEKLIEEGGNWDLRNRFKVYKGLYMMTVRKFREATEFFLDTTSTFTSYEILDYDTFMKYTALIAMVALPRNILKDKIIKGPEILSMLHSNKDVERYVLSLYDCQYEDFFVNLANVEQQLRTNFFLHPHCRYYVREMKIKAYSQLLESYRSLSLSFMARTFGVTEDYIDEDLSRFITAGRLTCKIDRIGGIVVTNRPDQKSSQFQDVLKHGDLLLNRVQKLSRVINI